MAGGVAERVGPGTRVALLVKDTWDTLRRSSAHGANYAYAQCQALRDNDVRTFTGRNDRGEGVGTVEEINKDFADAVKALYGACQRDDRKEILSLAQGLCWNKRVMFSKDENVNATIKRVLERYSADTWDPVNPPYIVKPGEGGRDRLIEPLGASDGRRIDPLRDGGTVREIGDGKPTGRRVDVRPEDLPEIRAVDSDDAENPLKGVSVRRVWDPADPADAAAASAATKRAPAKP